jgi:dihydropteroate synthase
VKQAHTLRIGNSVLDLSTPVVMGILNTTPDSFFTGSRTSLSDIVSRASNMLEEGATMLDVGGYSTRPGAVEISVEEECLRVIPAIEAIKKEFPTCIISVDSFRAAVAQKAMDVGAEIVNDVSGGDADVDMFPLVANSKTAYICMHSRGNPQTMQQLTQYENLLAEIIEYFRARLERLEQAGLYDVVLDPGFGFAKTIDQNFELLRNLGALTLIGKPILAGLSRKSMIWKTLGTSADEALHGTTALHMLALQQGVSILRVHDVRPAVETITLWKKACLPEL